MRIKKKSKKTEKRKQENKTSLYIKYLIFYRVTRANVPLIAVGSIFSLTIDHVLYLNMHLSGDCRVNRK